MDQDEKQAIIDDVLTRGVENIIPGRKELEKLLGGDKKLNVYLGIDPTAPHIHLGHAFNFRKLQQMTDLGHNVTFLIGDFTTKIGDNSDKDTERPLISDEQIQENLKTFKEQASKVIDFDKVTVVHNSDWLSELKFDDVIKLAGNFSVNDFNSRELIRKRLDAGTRVGLPELLYPLMQGYDSYHLDADIQFGGTDQTYNMQAGRTLNKRLRDKESYIVTSGFLTGTDGRKMSKSWGNAIWMDDSPEDVYGKTMRISDDLTVEYFTFATSIPLSDIEEVKKQLESGAHPMEIKKRLARRVVQELHGEEFVQKAEDHFSRTVVEKSASDDAPVLQVDGQSVESSKIVDSIIENKLAGSKSELRRLNDQGALYLNDGSVDLFGQDNIELVDGENQLRLGKRRYLIIITR